jgi:hypothetical protein
MYYLVVHNINLIYFVMNKLMFWLVLLWLPLFSACWSWSDLEEAALETEYTPVLMKRTDLEQSVKKLESCELSDPGKLYTVGKKVLVGEKYRGIHVIDNTDPRNPVSESFIAVPGCVDMALKDGVLYADNGVDLVAINIENGVVLKRIPSVFPELIPPDMSSMPEAYTLAKRPENTIIVGWEKKSDK